MGKLSNPFYEVSIYVTTKLEQYKQKKTKTKTTDQLTLVHTDINTIKHMSREALRHRIMLFGILYPLLEYLSGIKHRDSDPPSICIPATPGESPGCSTWLLASPWPTTGCYRHLWGVNYQMEDFFFLAFCLSKE